MGRLSGVLMLICFHVLAVDLSGSMSPWPSQYTMASPLPKPAVVDHPADGRGHTRKAS